MFLYHAWGGTVPIPKQTDKFQTRSINWLAIGGKNDACKRRANQQGSPADDYPEKIFVVERFHKSIVLCLFWIFQIPDQVSGG
jgi:hypothetical protein